MSNNLTQLLIPIFGFASNVVCQVLICRYFRKIGLLKSQFYGFIIGADILCCIEGASIIRYSISVPDAFGYFLLNNGVYCALAYGYFHFLNLGETARRVRLLRELVEAGGAGLSEKEIVKSYNAKLIIGKRIGRLIEAGQISIKNEKYYLASPLLVTMARCMLILKIIVLGKHSGLKR